MSRIAICAHSPVPFRLGGAEGDVGPAPAPGPVVRKAAYGDIDRVLVGGGVHVNVLDARIHEEVLGYAQPRGIARQDLGEPPGLGQLGGTAPAKGDSPLGRKPGDDRKFRLFRLLPHLPAGRESPGNCWKALMELQPYMRSSVLWDFCWVCS